MIDILTDLRERLERTRWPDEVPEAGWNCGTDLAYLKDLVTYWRLDFDWRRQEVELNRFRQFVVPLAALTFISSTNQAMGQTPCRC